MTRKYTTAIFKTKALIIHKDKYTYDESEYINGTTKLKIHCNTCKKMFWQTAHDHLRGCGCSHCAGNVTKTKEQFIAEATAVHNNKFNYTIVEYKSFHKHVDIICNTCGKTFSQQPAGHLQGYGCSHCAGNYRKTTEDFIIEAIAIHGSKFLYTNTKYNGIFKKIEIICNTCKKIFQQTAHDHLRGCGCPYCAGRYKDTEQFIIEAIAIHGSKFSYINTKYMDPHTKTEINCNKCSKIFLISPSAHLSGNGCSYCAGKHIDTAQFIINANKVHSSKFTYTNAVYINNNTKVEINCNKCNKIFWQTPGNHLSGQGCPYCSHKTELLLFNWFQEHKFNVEKEIVFEALPNARYDFYLVDYDLIVELDGLQHFKQVSKWTAPEITQAKDKLKMDFCLSDGLSVIRLLQEDVFYNRMAWQTELLKYIKKYKKPTIKFLCTKDEYDIFEDYYQYDPYFTEQPD